MLERLELMTDDQLAEVADNNETWDPAGQGDTPADATEGMRLFIADYEQCTEGGAAASTGTSEPSGSTEPTGSSEPTETTSEPAETGEPAETTEG